MASWPVSGDTAVLSLGEYPRHSTHIPASLPHEVACSHVCTYAHMCACVYIYICMVSFCSGGPAKREVEDRDRETNTQTDRHTIRERHTYTHIGAYIHAWISMCWVSLNSGSPHIHSVRVTYSHIHSVRVRRQVLLQVPQKLCVPVSTWHGRRSWLHRCGMSWLV